MKGRTKLDEVVGGFSQVSLNRRNKEEALRGFIYFNNT